MANIVSQVPRSPWDEKNGLMRVIIEIIREDQ
jgi:hypothetical protein